MSSLTHPLQRLARRLRREHDDLARRCEDLQRRADRGDWRVCGEIWDGLSAALGSHLDHEEAWLLPVYELAGQQESDTSRTLRREHTAVREEIERLGVAMQAHAARSGDVRALLRRLDDHARREDQSLYRWLDRQVTADHPPYGAHRPESPAPWERSRGRAP